jgi:UDP-N-acetylglucosamine 2-epimerase (non-hydrolysing)
MHQPERHGDATASPDPLPQRPVIVVAGARPNFMKVVPILHELDRRGLPRLFVHTGQHYDVNMSAQLLSDLNAPPPDVLLEVGSGTHAVQTARIMERFEPVLMRHQPSWVVVVGYVNSTLACALVTAKVRHAIDCRIAHVEAGLRSHDWTMPEEVNRVLTDRLSDLLLIPVEEAAGNLAVEGLSMVPTVFVGNVMIDALLATLPRARELAIASRFGLEPGSYILVTLHRPSNVDESERFALLLDAFKRLSESRPVVFPMHPRTRARVQGGPLEKRLRSLMVVEPLGYAEMVGMLDSAAITLTDSGGVQQESTILGVPCVTLREGTEWPSTVSHGTNRLAAWPPTVESVVHDALTALDRRRVQVGTIVPAGWDGRAASRIVDAMCDRMTSVQGSAVGVLGGGS